MKRAALLAGYGLFLLVIYGSLTAGCSSEPNLYQGDAGVTKETGGADVTDETLFVSDTGSGEKPACTKCSADLHSVVDCDDDSNVVQACPGDQGCLAGACVPACQAAEAGKSSLGCDYFTIYPDAYPDDIGDCFAAYIVNTWGAPVSISFDYDGETFNASDFAYIPSGDGQAMEYTPLPGGLLPSGKVAVLFLAATPTAPVQCPAGVTPALTIDPAHHGTGYGKAFHIQTSGPVVSYDIYPYGGGDSAITSATLLLPTSAWDTNYIAADAWDQSPWLAIVGKEDGTEVTLSPTAAIVGGTNVSATGKGSPQTYTLDRGDVLQFVQGQELIGTPIQSTKPVGVWGGSICMAVVDGPCDAAHQEIPPVRALGYEYVAVRYRDRYPGTVESPPWRLVGAIDGTVLTYEPEQPTGAPSTLDSGQMVMFRASDPFVVKAQDKDHPFYMAAYMTGCGTYETGDDCRGDPEYVNTIPPQQFLGSYTFFTDPTYPETNLVVVRSKVGGAFQPVHLDCAGDLSDWQDVGDYEWTRVDLVTGVFEPVGGCDNGLHVMSSSGPFGLTVWGWGSSATGGQYRQPSAPGFYTQAVSYAYPAGASIESITTVVVPPIPK